jgi:hypothetical protein
MDHLSGCGCPSCGTVKAKLSDTMEFSEFLSRSLLIHKNDSITLIRIPYWFKDNVNIILDFHLNKNNKDSCI